MAKIPQRSLFNWNAIEAKSDLERFYLVRDNLPDEPIVIALEKNRGKGRDDFPVQAMWNAMLAGIVFQHESIESLIRELSRNPSLLEACGFDPTPITKQPAARLERDEKTGKMKVIRAAAQAPYYQVPMSWNFSRFLKNVIELEDEHAMISEMVRRLRENLMAELPDFGKHLGVGCIAKAQQLDFVKANLKIDACGLRSGQIGAVHRQIGDDVVALGRAENEQVAAIATF